MIDLNKWTLVFVVCFRSTIVFQNTQLENTTPLIGLKKSPFISLIFIVCIFCSNNERNGKISNLISRAHS